MTIKTSGIPSQFLLFCDIETTGLNPFEDLLLEVAVLGVDPTTWDIKFAFSQVVEQPAPAVRALLKASGITDMHKDNGLLAEVEAGTGESLAYVEAQICHQLDEHAAGYNKVSLAGSGVASFDLPWLRVDMPGLASRLTYNAFDVSPMRNLYRVANGQDLTRANEGKTHRAMDDIHAHYLEMRAFAEFFVFGNGIVRGVNHV